MGDTNRLVTIHYSEIWLKGRNKGDFENALLSNIRKALNREHYEKLEKKSTRVLLWLSEHSDAASITSKLKKVFGIKWFSVALAIPRDIEFLKNAVVTLSHSYTGKTIKIDTKRADKGFPLTSVEINCIVGAELKTRGFEINLDNPQAKISIEVLRDNFLISSERIEGLGGLPVGTSGKLICLLSGGIDSPVAAWLMMKRGCIVDFVHMSATGSDVKLEKDSKIVRLIGKLREYAPSSAKLYFVPYTEFYKKTLEVSARNELVLFKRFLLRIAARLCVANSYLGVVSGDSVAQVASQTLQNLYATNVVTNLPVYRPLAGHDKEEIIDLAKKIGTYDISIEEYKDCCSLVAAKHPATRAKMTDLDAAENEINIEEVVEKTIAASEIIEV